jgi:hypothetical protein
VSELTFSAEGSLGRRGDDGGLAESGRRDLCEVIRLAGHHRTRCSTRASDESSDAVAGASNGTAKADKAGAHAEGATAAMTKATTAGWPRVVDAIFAR